jgi:3-isopropylmalate dehydrogenase
MKKFKLLVLAGDGIGPEVTDCGLQLINAIENKEDISFEIKKELVGGAAIDAFGEAIKNETIELAKKSDAVLWGAVGGPKWDNPSASVRPEQGLLKIRSELNLWANLRPVKIWKELIDSSSIKKEKLENVDILVIRELVSGAYFGKPQERRIVNGKREAVDTIYYNEDQIARIAHLGFKLAKKRRNKLHSIDKANVLESSRLWREVVQEIQTQYTEVDFQNILVDAATMHLIREPSDFDVVIASNMFGDIITDEASMLSGSLGMLPSASLSNLSDEGIGFGLYEPIHGSAPDITGLGIANPIAMFLV